jgi:transposase
VMLGISKNTVKGIVRQAAAQSCLESVALETGWPSFVAWDRIQGELGKKYVTIKCLHADYAPEGVNYLRFWRELQRRMPSLLEDQARIRFQYKPGVRVEVDYCDGIPITDHGTGKLTITHLFCGASSFSDYTFGEFVFTQKRDEFIASQDRMFHFFGGIFEYVVIDNLKSGVHRAHIYDPDVNPVYVEYANHMGFAVLPARPVTPRDKPATEGAIGVIQRQFFAEVRNRVFYSLSELNVAFREYLNRLNTAVMKDYGTTRAERFEEEKPVLKPLPRHTFEVAEYRTAKVHPDCHVQVDKNFYSVPYQLIGQSLRVRLTPRIIEVFNCDHESVAVHSRSRGYGKFSTADNHYPEKKLAVARFDIIYAQREALKIGPETSRLVEQLLTEHHPLRYLRRVQGILRLTKNLSSKAIEYGCHQATLFNRPRLAYITGCAEKFELSGHRPRAIGVPERDLSSIYLQPVTNNKEETELL